MKWTDPGHQLDELGGRLLKVKNLYLYGTDDRAKKAYDFLKWLGVSEEFHISFVLDITVLNREGSPREFCGKRVIPFQTELCDEMSTEPEESLIALPWISQTAEREILINLGIKNIYYLITSSNRRDNFFQNFVCVWYMYKHHKLLVHSEDYILTSKCNLNCKYCGNFTEYIKKPYEVSFEEFKVDIDTYFSKVDFLYHFQFCGGEPQLAKDLLKCVRYMEKYRDRIFDLMIITNGTILPAEELVSAVKALDGYFYIDDYSATVSNSKIAEIKAELKSYGVTYLVNTMNHWSNMDVMNTDNSGMSEEELECWKDVCNTTMCTLGEKRLYSCCYSKYAERAGFHKTAPDDYIEIEDTPKMEILEFIQGYSRKGYTSLCTRCRGVGENARQVAPAIQIPRKAGETARLSEKEWKGPLVSICVPIYNTGKYLDRCIKSLTGQTYRNLEIILVDDGSTDNSGLICDTYADLDARISVIHKPNGGEASSRNTGLFAATGEYVMFMDSDDEYLPDAVQRLVEMAVAEDTELVMGGYLERRGEVERFATGHQRKYSTAELAREYLTSKCTLGVPYIASTVDGKLFRRALIRDNHLSFDEHFVVGNDNVFICEYLRFTKTICDICAPIYVYYKFESMERLQGSGWFYPDVMFYYVYLFDRMLKLMGEDTAETRRILAEKYEDFLYGMTYASVNREHFEYGLLPYLENFCKLDLVQTGARMNLNERNTLKKEGALPTLLLSFLIVNGRYQALFDLLCELGRIRGGVPDRPEHIRRMVLLENDMDIADANDAADKDCAANNAILLNEIEELIYRFVSGQRTVEDLEARTGAAEARANEAETKTSAAEARANEAETKASAAEFARSRAQGEADWIKAQMDEIIHSKSWRCTEPLRAMMRYLRRR